MEYTIELFKGGNQTSSAGQTKIWSESDLDDMVKTFQPDTVPMIVGHNQTDTTPALGWVKNVWRSGQSLWGRIKLAPSMDQAVRQGLWRKISIGLYDKFNRINPTPGQYKLRHVAFVHIPAIKGLDLSGLPSFSEQNTDYDQYTFNEINTMEDLLEILLEEANTEFGEDNEIQEILEEIEQDLEETEVASEPEELIRLRALVAAQAEAMQRGEMMRFTEKLYNEGRLLPSQVSREELVNFLMTLNPADAELSFNEQSVTQLDMFKSLLQRLPAQVQFGEKTMIVEDPELAKMNPREKLHFAAKKMEKETGMSYAECVKKLAKSSPLM